MNISGLGSIFSLALTFPINKVIKLNKIILNK